MLPLENRHFLGITASRIRQFFFNFKREKQQKYFELRNFSNVDYYSEQRI